MYKVKSMYYHNAINMLIHKYCFCVTMQFKGDVSLSSRLILRGKDVDVLQIKSMIAIYTSKPNQGVTIPQRFKPNKSSNRYDITLGLGLC